MACLHVHRKAHILSIPANVLLYYLQQQTRRPPLLVPIDGTDWWTDGRTPDRYVDPAARRLLRGGRCERELVEICAAGGRARRCLLTVRVNAGSHAGDITGRHAAEHALSERNGQTTVD